MRTHRGDRRLGHRFVAPKRDPENLAMKPVANLAVIALASALLTPIVVGAVGTASPAQATEPASVVVAAAPAAPAEPACARKVKVVYAGYAGATGCAPATTQ
jgi:hypothetical protein